MCCQETIVMDILICIVVAQLQLFDDQTCSTVRCKGLRVQLAAIGSSGGNEDNIVHLVTSFMRPKWNTVWLLTFYVPSETLCGC